MNLDKLPPLWCIVDLLQTQTKQERLLAFGELIHRLPHMKSDERKIVQEWLRAKVPQPYVQLAQRFASAPKSFIVRALIQETSLEEINEQV
jgi:hypothetical protein